MHIKIQTAVIILEFLSALIGFLNYKKIKGIWKLFPFYLLFIGINELFFDKLSLLVFHEITPKYYDYFIIPIEICIFILLVRSHINSRKYRKVHYVLLLVYIIAWIVEILLANNESFFSVSYSLGGLLLLTMLLIYFSGLVETEEIMHIYKNGMFYVATGLLFFYVLCMPYYGILDTIYKNRSTPEFVYYIPVLGNIIMYSLFCIAFWRLKPEHTFIEGATNND